MSRSVAWKDDAPQILANRYRWVSFGDGSGPRGEVLIVRGWDVYREGRFIVSVAQGGIPRDADLLKTLLEFEREGGR